MPISMGGERGEVNEKRKHKQTVTSPVSSVKFYSSSLLSLLLLPPPQAIRKTTNITSFRARLPLLLCLTSLMCLNPWIPSSEFQSYLAASSLIAPPSPPLLQASNSRTGSLVIAAAAAAASATHGRGSEPTKLVRLAGEQAQFECQLGPLANNIIRHGHKLQLNPGDDDDDEPQFGDPRGVARRSNGGGGGQDGAPASLVIDESKARRAVNQTALPVSVSVSLSLSGRMDHATSTATELASAHLQPQRRSPAATSAASEQLLMEAEEEEEEEENRNSMQLGDSVEFILWYHSGGESKLQQPIYSADARGPQTQTQTKTTTMHLQPSPPTQLDSSNPTQSASLIPVVWRQVQQQPEQQRQQQQQQRRRQKSGSSDNGTNNKRPNHPKAQLDRLADDGNISIIEQPPSSSSSGGSEQLNYSSSQQHNSNSEELPVGSGGLLRNVISENSKHYAQARLSSRIRMLIKGTVAHLIMDKVEPADSGQYKCRVDFRFARTRYQLSQLDVIAPITSLQIRATDQRGIDLRPAAGVNSTAAAAASRMSAGQTSWAHTQPQADKQWPSPPMEQQQQQQRANDDHRQQRKPFQTGGKRKEAARHSAHYAAGEARQFGDGETSEAPRDDDDDEAVGLKYSQHRQQAQRHQRHHHRHHHSDLNHDLPATGSGSSSSTATGQTSATAEHKFVGLVEANEDETMNLECTAKDGWPRSRIGLWRADWPQVPMDTKRPLVARLMPVLWSDDGGNDGEAANSTGHMLALRLPLAVGAEKFGGDVTNTEVAITSGGHSINTRPLAHVASSGGQMDSFTSAAAATLNRPDNNNFRPSNNKSGEPSRNVNSTTKDDEWLAWMGEHLHLALAKFGQNLDKQAANFSSPSAPIQRTPLDIVRDLRPADAPEMNGARRPEVGDLEFRRLVRQNELILYVCGASNTYVQERREPWTGLSQGQRDKLATIGPIFTSIFVRPNARPKWIQMFLVGRRSVAAPAAASSQDKASRTTTTTQVGGQIELTPLDPGQSLQLNLAPFGKGERQLQFACQVGGSLPEAKVVWTRSYAAAAAAAGQPDASKSHGPLASETSGENDDSGRFESLSLNQMEASLDSKGAKFRATEEGDPTTNSSSPSDHLGTNGRPTQWSLLRLHNISLADHQTLITCSAFNERFTIAGDSGGHQPDVGHPTPLGDGSKLGTFVRLNITHVPVLRLELELDPDDKDNRRSDTTSKQADLNEVIDHQNYSYNSDNSDNINNLNDSDHQMIQTLLYGQNVTLACSVAFANPAIQEPGIEWSLNDTKLLMVNSAMAVKVVARIQLNASQLQQGSNHPAGGRPQMARYHFVEKLIVQFIDNNSEQQQQLLEVKCLARNAIGQAASNRVRLLIGHGPHCPADQFSNSMASVSSTTTNNNNSISSSMVMADKSSSSSNDKLDYVTAAAATRFDKNHFDVHCPVISDKSSSIYHWLATPTGQTKSVGIITHSLMAHMEMSKLNLPKNDANSDDNNNVFEGLKIGCWASDKFGSNHNAACQTIVAPKSSTRQHLPVLEDYNCAANVVQQSNQVHKRPQDNNNNPAAHTGGIGLPGATGGNNNQLINTTTYNLSMMNETTDGSYNGDLITKGQLANQLVATNKARLFISIECKDNQFGVAGYPSASGPAGVVNDNGMVNFDLYHKRGDTLDFMKHLASYPYGGPLEELRPTNEGLSFMLDLATGKRDDDDADDNNELERRFGENQSMLLAIERDLLVVVMSSTDANNNFIKPNVTLHMNAPKAMNEFATSRDSSGGGVGGLPGVRALQPLLLANKQTGGGGGAQTNGATTAADRFPRTSDSGHRDHLWVILATFSGSFVLVIIAWVCKSNGNGSVGNNSKSQGPKGNGLSGFKSNGLGADGCGSGGSGSGSGSCNSNSTSASTSTNNSSNHHTNGTDGKKAIDSPTTNTRTGGIYLMGPDQLGQREALARQAIYHDNGRHGQRSLQWAASSPSSLSSPSCQHQHHHHHHHQVVDLSQPPITDSREQQQQQHTGGIIKQRAFISRAQAAPAIASQTYADFLIIDSVQHQHHLAAGSPDTSDVSAAGPDKQQAASAAAVAASAILLIDPATCDHSSLTCSSSGGYELGRDHSHHHHHELYSPELGASESSAATTTLLADHRQYHHHHHHVEPLIHVHPAAPADQHYRHNRDAILRAGAYHSTTAQQGLVPDVRELGRPISGSESSNSGYGGNSTTSLGTRTAQSGKFSLNYHHHHRSPPINVTTVAEAAAAAASTATSPGGPNFELNSQGELTVTDESSSFVHEEPGIELVCHPSFPVSSSPSGWVGCAQQQSSMAAQQQQVAFGNSNCSECQRSQFITDGQGADAGSLVRLLETTDLNNGDSNNNGNGLTLTLIQSHRQHLSSPSSSSGQQSLSSTLKRNPTASGLSSTTMTTKTTRRPERVRFVDYQLDEHDSSCC